MIPTSSFRKQKSTANKKPWNGKKNIENMFFHALIHSEICMIMDLFFQRFGNIQIQIFKCVIA